MCIRDRCNKLGIKLHRIDFVKEYWDYVFTYFLEELKKGRTPNPDMLCNKFIKFDLFIKEAKRLGADYIATGHYARMENGKLKRSVDLNKDQTYFLADVKRESLKNVLFPVGEYTKPEIRKIAEENNLNVAHKKDSTGICFIGERNYQKFIENYLQPNPGDIIDVSTKEVIGRHTGLMNYTVGQRRNVGISGNLERHYVCGKNVNNNILYTSNETTAQIDVEDYEENHPETEGNTEANNTVGSNKVENPHTGDSILVYAVAGIIAIIGIATLTKKK